MKTKNIKPAISSQKRSRREEAISRSYNTQRMVEDHYISPNYFTLVGVFLHFWGYIDFDLESKGIMINDNAISQNPEYRLLTDCSATCPMSIFGIRKTLSHKPIMIHHGVNNGASQFVTGWTYNKTQTYKVKTYPRQYDDPKYFPVIEEPHLIWAIYQILTIIEELSIPAELAYTALTLRKSGINLHELSMQYLPSTNDANLKVIHKLKAFMILEPEPPQRTKITVPSGHSSLLEWAEHQNVDRIAKPIEKLKDGRFQLIGYVPTVTYGVKGKRICTLIHTDIFSLYKDLATLNNEDWVIHEEITK